MLICSFVDHDMLMRHFGHGIGHLQDERHQDMSSDTVADGDDDEVDDNMIRPGEMEDSERPREEQFGDDSEPQGANLKGPTGSDTQQ